MDISAGWNPIRFSDQRKRRKDKSEATERDEKKKEKSPTTRGRWTRAGRRLLPAAVSRVASAASRAVSGGRGAVFPLVSVPFRVNYAETVRRQHSAFPTYCWSADEQRIVSRTFSLGDSSARSHDPRATYAGRPRSGIPVKVRRQREK